MADEWILKDYDGGAVSTTLNGAISGAVTSIVVTSGVGLPDGTGGPYVIVVERGLATEEKILIDTRSGNTLTVQQRGYDGTVAQAHVDLSTVDHCLDAHSIKQANALAAVMDSTGSMACRSSGLSYLEIPLGTAGLPLVAGVAAPEFAALGLAGLAAAVSALLVPAGTVMATVGATADTGFFLIDGSSVVNAQSLYPALWARLPTSWKSGSTMIMPDARGRALFMDDASTSFTLGGVAGANTATIATSNLPVHTHDLTHDHPSTAISLTDPGHSHGPQSPQTSIVQQKAYDGVNTAVATSGTAVSAVNASATGSSYTGMSGTVDIANFTGTSGSAGSGAALDIRPAHLTVNFQIKAH